MKQIVRIALLFLFFAQAQAQVCAPITNAQIVNRWADSALIAWQGPLDTFAIRWFSGFDTTVTLGTIFNIYDTMAVVKPITACTNYNIQVMRECIGSFSQATGAFAYTKLPTGFQVTNIWQDSARVSWDGPVQQFRIDYGASSFCQGTGISFVVSDTTAILHQLSNCETYSVCLRYMCNGSLGPAATLTLKMPNYPIPEYRQHFHNFHCQDSIFGSLGNPTVYRGNHLIQSAQYNAGSVIPITYSTQNPDKYLIFGGNPADSNLSFTTPWVDFTGATKDVVFYFWSNNTTSQNDNVTLRVSADNGVVTISNIFTYAGNDSLWRKAFIDLAPYHNSATNKIRLIFRIDQTTASFHQFNNFLLDEIFIGDTSSCSPGIFQVNRPTPSSLGISRPDTVAQSRYQWGPVGFIPGNGNYSDTTLALHDSLYLPAVQLGTQWLYLKDTCNITPFDPWRFSKWHGPIQIDSNSTYMLTGKVYVDIDSNCLNGSSDLAMNNVTLLNLSTNSYYWTNASGEFAIPVNQGNHSLVFHQSAGSVWNGNTTTPASCSSDTIQFSTDSIPGMQKDFLRKPNPNSNLKINAYNTWVIQGSGNSFRYQVYSNKLAFADTVTVRIVLNPKIYTVSPFTGHQLISANPLTYQKKIYIAPTETRYESFQIQGIIDTSLIGTYDTIQVFIDTLNYGESNLLDNAIQRWCISVTAYDPNSKLVSHQGKTTERPYELTYRINFQNLGNYPAATVRVVDTLPSYFDYNNVNILATSHDCNISIDSNNIATFLFYNIQLPDSASDPEGSKGFIDYSIMLDQPMAVGDSVANRAHIFFDYQPAIITNWAWTKIVLPANFGGVEAEGLKFNMYPNPASTALRIELVETGKYRITLTDLAGRVLLTNNIEGRAAELDVHNLPNGVYVIGIHSEAKNVSGYQRVSILH